MITQHFSLTLCQSAKALAQTKAWQRVCLTQRSSVPKENRADEEEARCHNFTYTQAGVSPIARGKQCFVGQESGKFEVQFFVGKFSANNPPLHKAPNRQTHRAIGTRV